MEYRTVLRQFEVERMLADDGVDRDNFGVRYGHGMLELILETNAEKLDQLFPRFSVAHQTLYAVNAFVGEVCNGGISQFFFNAVPVLRDAVPQALGRIGDSSVMEHCGVLFSAATDASLQSIRSNATSWDEFLEFKGQMGEAAELFDNWFFEGQQAPLDRKMRSFVRNNLEEYVRICEGNKGLEQQWTRRTLRRLIYQYHDYCDAERRGSDWAFYDLLLHPDISERLPDSQTERRSEAQSIVATCFPTIEKAFRSPSRATFCEEETPSIQMNGDGWLRRLPAVTLHYYENEMDMLWGIAEWDGM